MSEIPVDTPEPVSPRTIDVGDLGAVCAALSLSVPPAGTTSMDVELLPGRVVTFAEAPGPPAPFVYVCASSLTKARAHVESTFGAAEWGPDTVDPDTLRLRGCLVRAGEVVIDAVHCPRADDAGVPCGDDCRPSLSFE